MRHPIPPLADLHAAAKHLTLRDRFKAQGLTIATLGAILSVMALLNGVQGWRLFGFLASTAWFAVAGALLWSQAAWKTMGKAALILGLASLGGLIALAFERRFTTNPKVMSGAAVWLFFSPSIIGAFLTLGLQEIIDAGRAPSADAAAWLEAVARQLGRRPGSFNKVSFNLKLRYGLPVPARAILIGSVMVIRQSWPRTIRVISQQQANASCSDGRAVAALWFGPGLIPVSLAPDDAAIIQRWQRDDKNDRDLWLPPPAAQVIGQTANW